MSTTELTHQVLRDNELLDCRLMASIPVFELHRLIVGIKALRREDILLKVVGDQVIAQGDTVAFSHLVGRSERLFARSIARHEFALAGVQLHVTRAFLNGVHLKIRKFGAEGRHELVHFFINNDEKIVSDNIIDQLYVLIPPNHYHRTPVHSWTRMKPRPGTLTDPQDEVLFKANETSSSCRQVHISVDVLRHLPMGDRAVLKANGEDQWTFRNVKDDESLIEIQRADWFRLLSWRNFKADVLEESGDCFSLENLPEPSDRALSVLADRAVYRTSNERAFI